MNHGFTIPKKCKIEGVAACKNTRYAIAGVKLDAKRKRLLATDGRMLVELPVPAMTDETTAVLPIRMFKALRKGGKDATHRIHCDGEHVTVSGETDEEEFPVDTESQFPEVDQLLKDTFDGKGMMRLCLNVAYLKRVADALGSDSVELYIKVEPGTKFVMKAIGVKPHCEVPPAPNARGVIMPIHMKIGGKAKG